MTIDIKERREIYLLDGGIVEVDPFVHLGVEEEGRVVFPIVTDDPDQLQLRRQRPTVVLHRVEQLQIHQKYEQQLIILQKEAQCK